MSVKNTPRLAREAAIPDPKWPGLLDRVRTAKYKGERIEWSAYLFVLPFVLLTFLFVVLPALSGIFVSFTDWTMLGTPHWVGLANFARLGDDPDIPMVLGNTFRYGAMVIPTTVVVALGLALFVNRRLPGYGLARTSFFLPYVLSVTVISIIWVWLLDTRYGIVNLALARLGIPNIPWLTTRQWVMTSIGLTSVWSTAGFFMVILLGGLQDIPEELYDAARVDGARGWQEFWFVTLPLLRPVLSWVLTMQTIGALREFNRMYIMTRGGPAGSSSSIMYLLWTNSFQRYNMGYGSAIAILLFGVVLLLTIMQRRLFPETAY